MWRYSLNLPCIWKNNKTKTNKQIKQKIKQNKEEEEEKTTTITIKRDIVVGDVAVAVVIRKQNVDKNHYIVNNVLSKSL